MSTISFIDKKYSEYNVIFWRMIKLRFYRLPIICEWSSKHLWIKWGIRIYQWQHIVFYLLNCFGIVWAAPSIPYYVNLSCEILWSQVSKTFETSTNRLDILSLSISVIPQSIQIKCQYILMNVLCIIIFSFKYIEYGMK